jgi:crossover junction endodeoxyribonuclease RuvC
MRILGIDPGLSTAGIGLIETDDRLQALDWLTITTDPALPLPDRLLELATDLEDYLREADPDLAVVETLFFATNKRTAMDVSQARGVIVMTLRKFGIRVVDATPLQLKTAITGDGKADKKQMQAMVKRTLDLSELPSPADAADGLALALYGAFTQGTRHAGVTDPPRTSHIKRPVS